MPYKSLAQERFFHAASNRGQIKPSVVKEFDTASKGMTLPSYAKAIPKSPWASMKVSK